MNSRIASVTDVERPDGDATTSSWQIRFEPGTTPANIRRIADFALAEGIAAADSADLLRAGRDPRFWYSHTLDRAEVDTMRRLLDKALNGEALAAADLDLVRAMIRQFDDWLREVAYPRAEIYDADDAFLDFD